MVHFLQEDEKYGEKLVVTVNENSDIFEIFRKFEGFLLGMTFSNSVIYHGLKNAVEEMEETLECDAGTYIEEVKEESQDCCEENDAYCEA